MRVRIVLIAAALGTLIAAGPAHATYPGRDGRIVFDQVAGKQLLTMRADGSGVRRLTHETGLNHQQASYSADGRRIVYQQGRAGSARIAVARANGTGVRVLKENGRDPVFSPDGKQIVFDNQVQILSMNSDGSALTPLTPLGGGNMDYAPAFSPNGSEIIFNCNLNPLRGSLCSMAPDGSDVQTFFSSDTVGVGEADFAPSGHEVLVTAGGPQLRAIATIGLADSKLHVIRNFSSSGRAPVGRPVFSPTGKQIALTLTSRKDRHETDVYVMRADGRHLRRLTHASGSRTSSVLDDWQSRPAKHA